MNQIVITINLGNEACRTNSDIAQVLKELARRFKGKQQPSKVMDLNGNSVGNVEYKD